MGESAPVPTGGESALEASVLVLNRYYAAIRVIHTPRAFALLFKNYAEALDHHEEQFATYDFSTWLTLSSLRLREPAEYDQFIQTPRLSILVPRIIRLRGYDKVPRTEVRLNRRNILSRDDHRCQYCGRRFPTSHLSIDHLLPKSRGGKSIWTNVVAACCPCNTRKGGRLPAEAGMKLLQTPGAPKRNPLVADKLRNVRYAIWRYFLGERYTAVEG